MNDFQYAQALFNYKENINYFNKKYNGNLIFEQDGAPLYISIHNKNLISKFFKDNFTQKTSNSLDLA